MQKKSTSKGRQVQKNKSSGVSKIFYFLMLLLILTSSFVRIIGNNRRRKAAAGQPTAAETASVNFSNSARLLVYHREDSELGTCEDLVITTSGSAVYTDCASGEEKQYALSDSERTLVTDWIDYFQQVDVSINPTDGGTESAELVINGQGSHEVGDGTTRQVKIFADDLIDKITTQT